MVTTSEPQYEKAHRTDFDRQLGICDGMMSTKISTVTQMNVMAIGGAKLFTIQTFRQHDRDEKERIKKSMDTIFIQAVINGETIQLVLPPKVADTIARQREALSARTRSTSNKEKSKRMKLEIAGLPQGHEK